MGVAPIISVSSKLRRSAPNGIAAPVNDRTWYFGRLRQKETVIGSQLQSRILRGKQRRCSRQFSIAPYSLAAIMAGNQPMDPMRVTSPITLVGILTSLDVRTFALSPAIGQTASR